jgi:glycosyltransferase involved in cell wall biosynthesis
MKQHHKPAILVYRNKPIKISETFIYNQSMLLNRYTAFLLGAKRPEGPRIPIDEDRLLIINHLNAAGYFEETLFKFFKIIPKNVMAWVRHIQPKLIHAHFGDDGAMIMPLAQKLGVPLIVSFLGTDATMKDEYSRKAYIRKRLYLRRRSQLAQMVHTVIVPSKYLMDRVVEHGFSPEKIRIIYHGVDLSKFENSRAKPEFGHILSVGRIVPRKGLNFLIRALHRVIESFPDIQLTVIGDGPARDDYEKLAKKLLGHRVTFMGYQSHQVVNEYMSKAYLFSMPSITMPSGESETFGLVFIEAQAMGVPVVSFDTGGIPEVVAHGETGLLCPEGQVDSLAKNIHSLLENPDLRNKMSAAGIHRVRQLFDLKKQTEELESFYDQVISNYNYFRTRQG